MQCRRCGYALSGDATACPWCGAGRWRDYFRPAAVVLAVAAVLAGWAVVLIRR
jgi:hypothetical protein